ncbi:hypothetical protein KKI43_23295 [Arthrobacter sp. GN70]|nr:hypothetical protein [Arthrobacter sp. GN70]
MAFSSKTLWWLCDQGHEWRTMVKHRTRSGSNCPTCRTWPTESRLRELLLDRFPGITHGGSPGIQGSTKGGMRCDIVIPELRFVIEYDGAWWHRNRFVQDAAKTQALLDVGFFVIRVREGLLDELPLTHPRLTQLTHDWQPNGVGLERLAIATGKRVEAATVSSINPNGASTGEIMRAGRWRKAETVNVYDREFNPAARNSVMCLGL